MAHNKSCIDFKLNGSANAFGFRAAKMTTGDPSVKSKPPMQYIDDRNKRHVTFSKRKANLMLKAHELSQLTGADVLVIVATQAGSVNTYSTPTLSPMITDGDAKRLLRKCFGKKKGSPKGAALAEEASGSFQDDFSLQHDSADSASHSHAGSHSTQGSEAEAYAQAAAQAHANAAASAMAAQQAVDAMMSQGFATAPLATPLATVTASTPISRPSLTPVSREAIRPITLSPSEEDGSSVTEQFADPDVTMGTSLAVPAANDGRRVSFGSLPRRCSAQGMGATSTPWTLPSPGGLFACFDDISGTPADFIANAGMSTPNPNGNNTPAPVPSPMPWVM